MEKNVIYLYSNVSSMKLKDFVGNDLNIGDKYYLSVLTECLSPNIKIHGPFTVLDGNMTFLSCPYTHKAFKFKSNAKKYITNYNRTKANKR